MTYYSLLNLLMSHSGRVDGLDGHLECTVCGVPIVCLADERADRMRIMAAVDLPQPLDAHVMQLLLEANFHSALDARLAVSDDVLWSLFVSPLSLLTEELATNGLRQVVTLALNAKRGEYRSGRWHFVG